MDTSLSSVLTTNNPMRYEIHSIWRVNNSQALQYLRKLCNHPLLVLTANHPEYTKLKDQLDQQHVSIRDFQHAAKLVALK